MVSLLSNLERTSGNYLSDRAAPCCDQLARRVSGPCHHAAQCELCTYHWRKLELPRRDGRPDARYPVSTSGASASCPPLTASWH